MAKKLVIIGGGDAGTYTVEALFKKGAEVLKQFEITLVKKEKGGSASICAVPLALQGVFNMKEVAEIDPPETFVSHGIDYRTETEATGINLEESSVRLGSLGSPGSLGSEEEIKYDFLVIATGRRPRVPDVLKIPGAEGEGRGLAGVYTMSTVEDGEKIEAAMNSPEAKNAVVLGGGTIGLQVALAFLKKGLKTRVVVGHPTPLSSILDPDMGSLVRARLEKEGVEFIFGKQVKEIKSDGAKVKSKVKSVVVGGTEAREGGGEKEGEGEREGGGEREEIPADIVVISRGMIPNTELAEKAGLQIGETGGIVTNQYLQVKRRQGQAEGGKYIKNVYALGDCVEVVDAITLRPRLSQLASSALVQAKVVANNLTGVGYSLEPALSPAVATISDFQVGTVGITTETAARFGMKVVSGKKEKPTRARFYQGRKTMAVKLLFDSYSERLVGAQLVSEEMVADRIDGLCNAIRKGVTAKELSRMEKSFDPCVSLHRDVMVDAAESAVEQFGKD